MHKPDETLEQLRNRCQSLIAQLGMFGAHPDSRHLARVRELRGELKEIQDQLLIVALQNSK
jgi:cell fate (sporulation/competence/biofilm development) regulator YlbF (YheA/YmcA/DUF963 family)